MILDHSAGVRVLVIDGLSQTPAYDAAMVKALAAMGCGVRLWAAARPEEAAAARWLPEFRVEPQVSARVAGIARRVRPRTLRAILRASAYLWDLRRLRTLAGGFDLVHVQWLPLLPWTGREVRVMKNLRINGMPIIYTAHNALPHEGADSRTRRRLAQVYDLADAILTHGEAIKREILAKFDVPHEKIRVVPMGPMHVGDGAVNDESRSSARRARLNGPLVVQFGTLRGYKGCEVLLRAVPLLLQFVPDAQVIVAGVALGDLRRRLEQLHADLELGASCRFRFGFLPDNELEGLLDDADAVVFPYLEASQSAAVISAMSRGCVVVASSVGSIPEVIRHGVDGYLVPPGDPGSLAEALRLALAEGAAWGIGERARDRVFSDFSWAENARRTLATYREVSRRRGVGAAPRHGSLG